MRPRGAALKILVFVGVLLVATFGVSMTAAAWSEGPDPDGLGTHDWILVTAVELAGTTWVDLAYALPFSDDPDTLYASGGATTVWVNFPLQKSAPLPDHMRALLT